MTLSLAIPNYGDFFHSCKRTFITHNYARQALQFGWRHSSIKCKLREKVSFRVSVSLVCISRISPIIVYYVVSLLINGTNEKNEVEEEIVL